MRDLRKSLLINPRKHQVFLNPKYNKRVEPIDAYLKISKPHDSIKPPITALFTAIALILCSRDFSGNSDSFEFELPDHSPSLSNVEPSLHLLVQWVIIHNDHL